MTVNLASLVLDGSPRLNGEDVAHIRLMADAGPDLPPILVHRQTMRVIDGMHRVRAAALRGEDVIAARFFDGDVREAFVQAVRANITHGLPLTLADRRAAAERILRMHPEWSDRAIASAAGLSAVTVRSIRHGATDRALQLNVRLGQDGRVRPLDATDGRRRAAELLADRPDASLRELARGAGVSVGTVRDVRRRVRAGQDPVPHPRPRRRRGSLRSLRLPGSILEGLKRDPSLRYSERGRTVVRWLDAHVVNDGDWSRIADAVPPHCVPLIAELAAGCAKAWEQLAEELAAREAVAEPAAAEPGRVRPVDAVSGPAGPATG